MTSDFILGNKSPARKVILFSLYIKTQRLWRGESFRGKSSRFFLVHLSGFRVSCSTHISFLFLFNFSVSPFLFISEYTVLLSIFSVLAFLFEGFSYKAFLRKKKSFSLYQFVCWVYERASWRVFCILVSKVWRLLYINNCKIYWGLHYYLLKYDMPLILH